MIARFAGVLAAAALFVAGNALADTHSHALAGKADKAAAAPATKGTYLVTAPHTDADCKAAMAEMGKPGGKIPGAMWASCHHGDHTAYCMVEADSADAAKAMIPAALAKNAKVAQVDKIGMDEMKAMHPATK